MRQPGINTIEHRLGELIRANGDGFAVRFKERTLTFSEVGTALATLATKVGSFEGLRAVIMLPDGIETYLFHLASFVGRGTIVPLSPSDTTDHVGAIVSRVRPHLFVTSPPLLRKYAAAAVATPVLLAHKDKKSSDGAAWDWSGDALEPVGDRLDDVRVLLFTSGSTGVPKGVCLGRECLESAARMNVGIVSLTAERRSLVTVPLFDYYGLIQIYSHLLVGAGLVLGETPAFAADLVRQAARARVTDLIGVPFGLRRIFRAAIEANTSGLDRLQVVTSSSETLSPDVLQLIFDKCPGVTVFDIYGLTEAGRACRRVIRRDEPCGQWIGRSSEGVTITGGTSPENLEELVIHGPNVMLGYLQELTPEGRLRYESCTSVRTGDLGYVDGDGNVHLAGRTDHLLNVRGNKIHPSEIESVALQAAGVSDARVRLNPGPEPELILEIVGEDPGDDYLALRLLMRERLPFQFVPSRISRVASIARTEIGSKMVRR